MWNKPFQTCKQCIPLSGEPLASYKRDISCILYDIHLTFMAKVQDFYSYLFLFSYITSVLFLKRNLCSHHLLTVQHNLLRE